MLPLEQDRKRAQDIRRQLSHGSLSDLVTLLHAFNGYSRLMQASSRDAQQYCRTHFLQPSSMAMISEMKRQFFLILKDAGMLEERGEAADGESAAGGSSGSRQAEMKRFYNERSGSMEVVHAVAVSALYPNAARVTYQAKRGGVKAGKPRLSTRDQLTNVRIHPSSVISMRDLDPISQQRQDELEEERDEDDGADDGDDDDDDDAEGGDDGAAGPGSRAVLAPWLMYYEVMRSSQVFLRCTAIASPLLLAVVAAGTDKEGSVDRPLMGSSQPERKAEEMEVDDDEDEDEDEEDEAEDDDGGDVVIMQPAPSPAVAAIARPSSASPSPSAPSRLRLVALDDFASYAMTTEDAGRVQAVRRFLHWLLHCRIIKSHIRLLPGAIAAGQQRGSDAADAAQEQLEAAVVELFSALFREDRAGSGREAQDAAAPPLYVNGGHSMYGGRGRRGRGGEGMPMRGGSTRGEWRAQPSPGRGRGGGGAQQTIRMLHSMPAVPPPVQHLPPQRYPLPVAQQQPLYASQRPHGQADGAAAAYAAYGRGGGYAQPRAHWESSSGAQYANSNGLPAAVSAQQQGGGRGRGAVGGRGRGRDDAAARGQWRAAQPQ